MPRARSPVANFAKLLDTAALPIYLLDDDRRIVYCNAACAAWLGVPAEELIGVRCSYHSSSETSRIDTLAAILCPPPEVFGGERRQSPIASPIGPPPPATRQAEFLPLIDESGEIALILAIVDLPAVGHQADISSDVSDESLHDAVRRFRQSQAARYRVDRLIGRSPKIARAREQVAVAIDSAASLLVIGSEGSGKDHVVRTIHYRGGEPFGPLVPLACASLGVELLVSTLATAVRNHPRRTGTGDSRPTGTLFLSAVDELPIDVHQEFARLLVLEGTSLRLLATSARRLDALAAKGEFRADLACVLATLEIELPTLAERLEDLPMLVQLFLEEQNARGGKQIGSVTPEALDRLLTCAWPGNLDELAAVVAETHENAMGPTITPRDLPKRIGLALEAAPRSKQPDKAVDLEEFLARVERELIERALSRAKGNKTRAAKLLGMTRPKLYRRLVQLGLAEPE
jgi:DNA-binding NtrC family response regulator